MRTNNLVRLRVHENALQETLPKAWDGNIGRAASRHTTKVPPHRVYGLPTAPFFFPGLDQLHRLGKCGTEPPDLRSHVLTASRERVEKKKHRNRVVLSFG